MKPVHTLTDGSLRFHANDAAEAISANPRNPKAAQYLRELNECEREIARRERVRVLRGMRATFDPLTVPLQSRKYARHNAYYRNQAECAMLSLAYLR